MTTDLQTVNSNDVRRFVYAWFTLFEHRAPAERLAAHLPDGGPLSLAFPGADPLRTRQQFIDWYRTLLANTRSNFHEITALTVEAATEGTFDVRMDIDWQGELADGSTWPANRPDRRFAFAVRQHWQVAVQPGDALEDPLHIVDLVAEPR